MAEQQSSTRSHPPTAIPPTRLICPAVLPPQTPHRANRNLPDVAIEFDVLCINTFDMISDVTRLMTGGPGSPSDVYRPLKWR